MYFFKISHYEKCEKWTSGPYRVSGPFIDSYSQELIFSQRPKSPESSDA